MLEQFDRDRRSPDLLPQVGRTIYVYDGEEFKGGRATVKRVTDGISQGESVPFVEVEERPGRLYNWLMLSEQQAELRQAYGEQQACIDSDPSRTLGTYFQIESWFIEGRAKGATHMIIVCDTWDHKETPIYVMPGQNVRVTAAYYNNEDPRLVPEYYEGIPCAVSDQMLLECFNSFDKKDRILHTGKVMEVYSLSLDMHSQLDEPRAFHFD